MAERLRRAALKRGMDCRLACGARVAISATCVVSLLLSGQRASRAEDCAAGPEESVLVATSEAACAQQPAAEQPASDSGSPLDECDGLEPTPESSDRQPDLAVISGSDDSPANSRRARTAVHEDDLYTSSVQAAGNAGTSAEPSSLPFEPVKFQGILVGKSTRQHVVANWGQPDKTIATAEGDVLAYQIHPFEAVEVLVGTAGEVSAIKIALRSPLEPADLAQQLGLAQYRPAVVTDEEDHPLGQVFPERGVLFMFETAEGEFLAGDGKAKTIVTHVVVQPLTAAAFAMRVENTLHGPYTDNVADLRAALAIEPNFAHAHYLLAEIYLATGQADQAAAAAAKACDLATKNVTYQLCHASTQELLGEYDRAVLITRDVLDRQDLVPIEQAQALYQMARLASLGDVEIAAKAIPFYTRAIEAADPVATSANGGERRAAKRLLIEAHMAMAEEIARQSFNEKIESLSLWIGRASGLAEECIANDGGSVALRLTIAQRALGALASFRPTLDPEPWVVEAEEAARALLRQSDDELWQARVRWELGIAYSNALRVEHVRRETTAALQFGQLAVDNLAEGAALRQAVHSSEQAVGQLYFQMGAVYAVHKLDHQKAAQWYDKAIPLLTGPRPVSELYTPRREGEMLVSMGVTYWQLGEQARALQLTQTGVNLVELAVESGILAKTALAVPYGNLATMYKQIGETTSAAKYAELAKSVAVRSGEATSRLGQSQPAGSKASVEQTSTRQPRPAGAMR
jgi:tetratricopeptide (TPR) repeat protein